MREEGEVYLIIEQSTAFRARAIVAKTDEEAKMAAEKYVHFESNAQSVGLYRSNPSMPDRREFVATFTRTSL